MESVRQKCKRVWGRCRSYNNNIIWKFRESFGKSNNKKNQVVAPKGCLWVYVGPHRERFLVKIELANHPMFKELLDDTESEYGYRNDGPIWLPCDVNLFCEAVAEMEIEIEEDKMSSASWACSFHHHKRYPNSLMQSPLSYLSSNHTADIADYELLRLYI